MKSRVRWVRTGAVVVLSIGAIVVLLIWLAGGFHEKIEPGPAQVGMRPLGGAPTVAVEPEARTKIRTYVTEKKLRPVTTKERIAVGATVPSEVELVD